MDRAYYSWKLGGKVKGADRRTGKRQKAKNQRVEDTAFHAELDEERAGKHGIAIKKEGVGKGGKQNRPLLKKASRRGARKKQGMGLLSQDTTPKRRKTSIQETKKRKKKLYLWG